MVSDAARQIDRYVSAYRHQLFQEAELDEEDVERAGERMRKLIRSKLERHRSRARHRADAPARAARRTLFDELGPQRAAEVLWMATSGSSDAYNPEDEWD